MLAYLALAGAPVLIVGLFWALAAAAGAVPRRRSPPGKAESCAVVIPAYNEERVIQRKLENTVAAAGRLERVVMRVGLDGCTDGTRSICEEFRARNPGVAMEVYDLPRMGKSEVLNYLVSQCTEDVIVSTDADSCLPPDVLRHVVAKFRDDGRLACISSVPVLGGNWVERLYWRLEQAVRGIEGRLGALIVVSGCAYAYARNAHVPIPEGIDADDLWIPYAALRNRRSVQVLPTLRCTSDLADDGREAGRKRRVIRSGMRMMETILRDRGQRRGVTLLFYFFHKAFRWAALLWLPYLLVVTAAFSPLLAAGLVAAAGVLTVASLLFRWRGPRYLARSLWAPVLALSDVWKGHQEGRGWEQVR